MGRLIENYSTRSKKKLFSVEYGSTHGTKGGGLTVKFQQNNLE
jgi:hypothetical protein